MSEVTESELDVLMERIRAELNKSKEDLAPAKKTLTIPSPQLQEGRVASPKRQHFSEFRPLDNEAFVREAYIAALGREPDEMGRLLSLHRLETGQAGRAILLRELLNSAEGTRIGAKIAGLAVQTKLESLRYNRATRALGGAVRLIRNSPRIANYMRQLAAQAATAERVALTAAARAESAQRIARTATSVQTSEVIGLIDTRISGQHRSLEQAILTLQRESGEHDTAFTALEGRLQKLEELQHQTFTASATKDDLSKLDVLLHERLAALDSFASKGDLAQAILPVSTEIRGINAKLREHWRNSVDQKLRLESLLAEISHRASSPLSAHQINKIEEEDQHLSDAFYVSFEDRYRGTRKDIKGRQEVYLPEIKRALKSMTGAVVDIGCGRGEWLELLGENGISAYGIDSNRIMVEEARGLGLDVRFGDAAGALTAIPENSVVAVTGFHVIEHLPFKSVVRLLDEALRILRVGGVIIVETPNPGNLLVASERFYFDPTHRNPVPAELMAFVAEARGFSNVETRFLHPPLEASRPEPQEPALLTLLRQRIYAPQDYAVIGWKA